MADVLDKEVQPLLDKMITTELKGAMRRFFANYVLQLVGELYDSTSSDIKEFTSDENLKMKAFVAIVLKSDKVKAMFVKVLDEVKNRKDEIVALLLQKYGCLYNNPAVTYYHDKVGIYFAEELELAKDLIKTEKYSQFYRRASYN